MVSMMGKTIIYRESETESYKTGIILNEITIPQSKIKAQPLTFFWESHRSYNQTEIIFVYNFAPLQE